jgi:hypothetical protein
MKTNWNVRRWNKPGRGKNDPLLFKPLQAPTQRAPFSLPADFAPSPNFVQASGINNHAPTTGVCTEDRYNMLEGSTGKHDYSAPFCGVQNKYVQFAGRVWVWVGGDWDIQAKLP